MKSLFLTDVIGKTISSLRYIYNPENEFHLQEFHSYIKLEDGNIIGFPNDTDELYLKLTSETIEYLRDRFNKADELSEPVKAKIEGNVIVDIYFLFNQDDLKNPEKTLLKLSNGILITENNFGPVGVTDIDLIILTEDEFQKYLQDRNQISKSYLREIK